MITIEIWGPAEKKYGPILACRTSIENVKPKEVCDLIREERIANANLGCFLKVMVNGSYVPTDHFLREYSKNFPEKKPTVKIYFEPQTSSWVVVNVETKEDLFKGDKWAVEDWLDEHGYFADDNPKFSV